MKSPRIATYDELIARAKEKGGLIIGVQKGQTPPEPSPVVWAPYMPFVRTEIYRAPNWFEKLWYPVKCQWGYFLEWLFEPDLGFELFRPNTLILETEDEILVCSLTLEQSERHTTKHQKLSKRQQRLAGLF